MQGKQCPGAKGHVCQRGAVLVVALLLMLVLAILGAYGLGSAALEMRMAANNAHRERAFQAAEFAVEQALRSADLRTAHTYASPLVVPASGPAPLVPGSSPDTYSYRLYYDTAAGPVPVLDGAHAGQFAYHFVIEASGSSLRGARAMHVQGFYVLAPAGSEALDAFDRKRTTWMQQDAE